MKNQLSGSDAAYAKALHKKSLIQAKKAAVALGWLPKFVDEVANLNYSLHYLQSLNHRGECSKKQLNAIVAVRDHASYGMLASFKLSQM